jgi:hypothetical protein
MKEINSIWDLIGKGLAGSRSFVIGTFFSACMRGFGFGLGFQEVHEHLPGDMRFCPSCPSKIQDDKHFFLYCPAYKDLEKLYGANLGACNVVAGLHDVV